MSYDLIKCARCGKHIDPCREQVQPHQCAEEPKTEGYDHNKEYLEEKENMRSNGIMKSGKEKRRERREAERKNKNHKNKIKR